MVGQPAHTTIGGVLMGDILVVLLAVGLTLFGVWYESKRRWRPPHRHRVIRARQHGVRYHQYRSARKP
jgi:hypothetical protein